MDQLTYLYLLTMATVIIITIVVVMGISP